MEMCLLFARKGLWKTCPEGQVGFSLGDHKKGRGEVQVGSRGRMSCAEAAGECLNGVAL